MPLIPSFTPYGDVKYVSMTAILIETQYYHIPSIGNGDAACAARALEMLCFRAAQPTLSQKQQHAGIPSEMCGADPDSIESSRPTLQFCERQHLFE